MGVGWPKGVKTHDKNEDRIESSSDLFTVKQIQIFEIAINNKIQKY